MPRLTVLLPVHRPPALLPHAIESVLAQSVADFELMVICDGAPEETVACARSYGTRDQRVKTFVFPKGKRHGEAHRHTALTQASGRFVAHICDDDLWFSNHLEEIERLLADADFGHVINVAVNPDGGLSASACDLTNPNLRKRFTNAAYNKFGPTFCAYRLDAYRRLPEGWTPAPSEVWTDLHMWRKFLRRDDMKFASRGVVTALQFPALRRRTMSLEDRAAENERWHRRIQDAGERTCIVEQAIQSLNAQLTQHDLDVSGRWNAPLRAAMRLVNRRR